ncbi:MAG TPA: Calx-beta domain-containing protein [Nocardioides sp.]|nr:Calx-beta domain-containing protein [Nocardioides sp.]
MPRSVLRSYLSAAVVIAAASLAPVLAGPATATGHPSLVVGGATVREGDSGHRNLVFTVRLRHAAGSKVTVSYATAAGTASSPSDFVRTTGTLTFRGATVVRHVAVPIVGDRRVEPDEWFRLVLGRAHGATIAIRSARGTIRNDDERLTYEADGSGIGTVTSDPAGLSCSSSCSHVFPLGTVVALSEAAGSASAFGGWSGDCSGTSPCQVTMTAPHSVGATFDLLPSESLTVNVPAGGVVTSSDSSIDCGAVCQVSYPQGTPVALTETPDDHWQFAGWADQAGDPACAGTASTCSLDLESADTVTATFLRLITITVAGPGKVYDNNGHQLCPDAMANTTCDIPEPWDTSVSFIAVSDATGIFQQWSGPCGPTSTGSSCVVDPGGPVYVSAIFNMKPAP